MRTLLFSSILSSSFLLSSASFAQVAAAPLLPHDGASAHQGPTAQIGAQALTGLDRELQTTPPQQVELALGLTAPLTEVLRLDLGLSVRGVVATPWHPFGGAEEYSVFGASAGLRRVFLGDRLHGSVGGGLALGASDGAGTVGAYLQGGISATWSTVRPFADLTVQQLVTVRGAAPRWALTRTGIDLGRGRLRARGWLTGGVFHGELPRSPSGPEPVLAVGYGLGLSYALTRGRPGASGPAAPSSDP